MKYLESKEGIGNGALVLKGTRIKIALILQFMKAGHSLEEINKWYPWISMKKLSGAVDEAIARISQPVHV